MLGWAIQSTSIPQGFVGYSLVHGGTMKKGDVVVRTSEEDSNPMIYMGIGLWTGWIHVYCPKEQRRIQVRRTYVKKADIKCP